MCFEDRYSVYVPFVEFSGIPKVSVVQPCRVSVFWSIHATLFVGDLTSIANSSFRGFPFLKHIVTLTSLIFMACWLVFWGVVPCIFSGFGWDTVTFIMGVGVL